MKRGPALNEHANFETFPNALLLLFRIATADEWTGIMDDISVAPPLCDPAAGNCGSALGPFYIMSFTLLTGQIMLNLFTTIVIETFEEMDEVRPWVVCAVVVGWRRGPRCSSSRQIRACRLDNVWGPPR